MSLPLPKKSTPVTRPDKARGPSDVSAISPGARLLIVDDEDTIRAAIRRFFGRRGWIVDEAADGAVALEKILAGGYDAIVSDIRLPALSGIELHDTLAATRPELLARLILATGDTGDRPAAALAERAQCPILQKPFELAALAKLIEAMRQAADQQGGQ